jgi:phospholipid/cholesterol/gamma-HCH transport system substrate-binding protein
MENRSHALMTGVFTIALLVAAVLAGLWLNRDRSAMLPFEIVTTQSIPGLNPQATVRYRGLEVGRVDDIAFDPKVTGQILIRLSVDASSPITTTTFASLGYQGVTGIAFVQLDDERTGSPLLRSDADHPGRIPLRPGLFDQLEKRGLAILEQTERITNSLDKMMNPAHQQSIVDAVDNIGKAAAAYGALPRQLEPTLARLPAMTRKIDELATAATSTLQNVDRLASDLQAPDGPIAHLNTTLDRVGSSLDGVTNDLELQTLPHVVTMTEEAKSSLRAVKRTANSLSERPQSLLFGVPGAQPGPGEPGFAPPTK